MRNTSTGKSLAQKIIPLLLFWLQRPTAHKLLQCLFIRGAKETCGLESVFDLYWKYKLTKDKLLHNGELQNDNSPFDDEE